MKKLNSTKAALSILNEPTRSMRLLIVNAIMVEISSRSRRFFHYKGKIAELVDNGKIHYKAEYGSKKMMCLDVPDYIPVEGWFHGGTLMRLVKEFRDYINDGEPLESSGLYSPHWGYPESDMQAIRDLAIKLGYLLKK